MKKLYMLQFHWKDQQEKSELHKKQSWDLVWISPVSDGLSPGLYYSTADAAGNFMILVSSVHDVVQ